MDLSGLTKIITLDRAQLLAIQKLSDLQHRSIEELVSEAIDTWILGHDDKLAEESFIYNGRSFDSKEH